MSRHSDESLLALHARYMESEEHTVESIALEAGVSQSTLRRRWKRLGLTNRPPNRSPSKPYHTTTSPRAKGSDPAARIVRPSVQRGYR